MIEAIKKLIRGERSNNKLEEIYSEKRLEQIYHFWEHVWEEIELMEKLWQLDFVEHYETYKNQAPWEIFKAWQKSIISELQDIYSYIHSKKAPE